MHLEGRELKSSPWGVFVAQVTAADAADVFSALSLEVRIYIYIYLYMCVFMYMYI